MDRPKDGPPRPPAISRALSFGAPQLIGIPLLLALPVLALFGVFGVKSGAVAVTGPGVEVHVSYPERLRYKVSETVEIGVRNTGGTRLSRVTISIDRAYLSAFSEVRFTPDAKEVTGEGYVIELWDLAPGGERYVTASVQADAYGRHRGSVRIAADAGAELRAELATLVFP